MSRRGRKKLTFALLGVVICAVVLLASFDAPYQGFNREIFVRFELGTPTTVMADMLQKAGVIRFTWQFDLLRILNRRKVLQAGEYQFHQAASVREVYRRIASGDIYHVDVTIPEGSNVFDIARILEERKIMDRDEFLRAAFDPSMIQDLTPQARSLEGYLFPATYRLSRSVKPREICEMMTGEFRREWKKLGMEGREVHRIVTLASLVEKETGIAAERPKVASVFWNRLKIPMRLACDPTTIYAALLENRYHGEIRKADLASRNPYNTYQKDGLPPGPIANPGAESIRAAINPADSDYLYFVAKPDGSGHQFSTSLKAHERAVAEYRAGLQARRSAEQEQK